MIMQDSLSNGRHTHFDDSDGEESCNVLTLAKASDLCPKPYRLIARNQKIAKLADLSTLSALDYIDLSSNSLTSLEGLDHPRLKTLIVARNKLSHLKPLYNSPNIRVLNVSENLLPDIEWISQTRFAPLLLTLVASSNQLHNLIGLSSLSSLETLVISNNQIEDLTPITYLKTLVKLSASRNRIRKLPSLFPLERLAELRLSHNLIDSLPTERLHCLKILDVGHNRLNDIDALSKFAPSLVQVNLRHNPVCERSDLRTYVKRLCDGLEVIDGERILGGRRKVRVNRIRKAAGFEIEHERRFARMPSEYYLKRLEGTGLLKDDVREHGDNQKTDLDTERKKAEHTDQRRKQRVEPEEHGVEMDSEKFVQMARWRSQKHEVAGSETKVTVHNGSRLSEEKQNKRKRQKKTEQVEGVNYLKIDSFGDGGTSRW